MPLKCVTTTGETLLAFQLDADAWSRLAAQNRRDAHLAMACCGRPAVLKTSPCGTRFFAHARKEGTACPRESEEHLRAKELIARAVLEAGWGAEPEATIDGRGLVADVLATRGNVRVAFEVQWSRQSLETTVRRHQAYEAAGVRALWLFKQADYPEDRGTPAFRLVPAEDGDAFSVWVWQNREWRARKVQPSQTVDLSRFVRGALSGRLRWTPAIGLSVPAFGRVATMPCRRGHQTKVLAELELDIASWLPGHPNPILSVARFADRPEFLRTTKAQAALAMANLALDFGLWRLPLGRGTQVAKRVIYLRCSTCGELLEDYRLNSLETTAEAGLELHVVLSDDFVEAVPRLRRELQCWWFDEAGVRANG